MSTCGWTKMAFENKTPVKINHIARKIYKKAPKMH